MLFLIALSASAPVGAAEPAVMGLDEAIALALEGNGLLAAESAARDAAEASLRVARAVRWPKVEVREVFLRTDNPVAVFGNLLNQERFAEKHFDPSFLNQPPPLSDYQTRLELSQPLWSGGRIGAGVRAAASQTEASRQRWERVRQEVVFRVIDSFTGAVLARRHLEMAEDSFEAAQAHVELVRDLFQGGLVVEADLLQAQVRLSELEEGVVRARSAAENSRRALNLEIGRDLEDPARLPAEIEVPEPLSEPVEELVREAVESRPDIRAVAAAVEAARQAALAARRHLIPDVGWQGSAEHHAEEALGSGGQSWSLMVGVRWTPFDGFAARGRRAQAEAELRRLEELERRLEAQAHLEVRSAADDRRAAEIRRRQAAESVQLARRSVEIVEDRYREGLTTVVELLEAESGVSRSRSREVEALRDLVLSHAALELALGRL